METWIWTGTNIFHHTNTMILCTEPLYLQEVTKKQKGSAAFTQSLFKSFFMPLSFLRLDHKTTIMIRQQWLSLHPVKIKLALQVESLPVCLGESCRSRAPGWIFCCGAAGLSVWRAGRSPRRSYRSHRCSTGSCWWSPQKGTEEEEENRHFSTKARRYLRQKYDV